MALGGAAGAWGEPCPLPSDLELPCCSLHSYLSSLGLQSLPHVSGFQAPLVSSLTPSSPVCCGGPSMPWGQAQPVTPTILLTDAPALQGPFLAPLFSIALAIINQRIGFTHLYFVYCPSPALSPCSLNKEGQFHKGRGFDGFVYTDSSVLAHSRCP